MKDQSQSVELLIQRCIDGELLDEEQLILLIQQLDANPENNNWRRLALGFIEDQCLRNYFQDANRNSPVPETSDLPQTSKSPTRTGRSSKWQHWSSLLAMLLLGVFVTLGLNSALQRNGDDFAKLKIEKTATPVRLQSATVANAPYAHLSPSQEVDRGSSPFELRPAFESPQLTSSQLTPSEASRPGELGDEVPFSGMLFREPLFPVEIQHQLEDMGFFIERQQRTFMVPSENGRSVPIPAETIRVRQVR